MRIVTLCGSTKFREAFERANQDFTMKGEIVLSVGFFMHSTEVLITDEEKKLLDHLHFRKIDMSDGIYVLNVGGYIGQSTAREIAYAVAKGKTIGFLNEELGNEFMISNSHRLGAMVGKFIEGRIPEIDM